MAYIETKYHVLTVYRDAPCEPELVECVSVDAALDMWQVRAGADMRDKIISVTVLGISGNRSRVVLHQHHG